MLCVGGLTVGFQNPDDVQIIVSWVSEGELVHQARSTGEGGSQVKIKSSQANQMNFIVYVVVLCRKQA